jgi:hypothetical protein
MSKIKSTQDGRFECLLWLRPLSKSVPRRFYLFHLQVNTGTHGDELKITD